VAQETQPDGEDGTLGNQGSPGSLVPLTGNSAARGTRGRKESSILSLSARGRGAFINIENIVRSLSNDNI